MSNNSRSATSYDLTEFSYISNEQNYTGVYLNQHFLENISIGVLNEPESTGEAIDSSDTEVVHVLDQLNPPEQSLEIIPGPVINIVDLNETPLTLNLESYEPVVESYYRNNTALGPISIDNACNNPNIRDIRNELYFHTSLQHFIPGEQGRGQFSGYKIVNAHQSYSPTFRPLSQNYYGHNNNTSDVQEYDPYSSRISPSSSYRCESDIKYCKSLQNKFDFSNTSTRDPRLMKLDKNKFFERRLDNFDGLTPIRYNNRGQYLNENLKTINMKLKNMNSSYKFSVVNDLRSINNFNEDSIRHREEPCVENTRIDKDAESNIDQNNYLNNLNTERCQKQNVEKMFGAIDLRSDNEDIVNDMEARRTSNVSEKYHKEKMELGKSRGDERNKLTKTVGNIIDNLNDDISDSRCTTKTLLKEKDVVIESHNLKDKTKNNIEKSKESILTVDNYKFDNKHNNVDNICGLIEIYQNIKTLSGQSIETIDLTNNDTDDAKVNKNVDSGMFTTKLKDTKIISMANEDKHSKNQKKLRKNKNETNIENIILNEDHSVVDQRQRSEKKSHEYKSNKYDKFKGNSKHSETYTNTNLNKTYFDVSHIVSEFKNTNSSLEINSDKISNKQTNNSNIWIKRVYFEDETDDELKNGTDGIYVLENFNTDKIRIKNITELNEINQNEIINSVETVYGESCVGVELNPNISTESAKSATNVGEKIHYARDEISIREQDTKETIESNFIGRSYRYKNRRSPIDLNKFIQNNIGFLHRVTNADSLKSNTTQLLPKSDPCFKNVDDEQIVTYKSSNDATQSQTVFEEVVNEYSRSSDASEFNYNLSLPKMEQFEDLDDKHRLIIDIGSDETILNAPFEDDSQSPRDSFIGDRKSDEESVDTLFMNYILNEDSETCNASELNKGLNNDKNVHSVENQDTKISEFIDDDGQLPNVECLTDDDILSADKPPTDVQNVGEHFEMDYFYNIIKIKHSVFRVNLHTEDDIFNFIQLYSQRTQTSWRVLKSFKSRKYDVCKIFGCLHNGLFKLLKKQDKNFKINKFGCQSEIDIKIKCSTIRGKKCDSFLKNGLPAVVRFKNKHNHLVSKVTDLPLLKSITDNNIKITLDNGFEPAKIFQAYQIGNSPNLSPSAVDTSNSSESDVEDNETNNLSTCNPSTENEFFSKWEDIKIQCDIVQLKPDGHLGPGKQIINNGECTDDDGISYKLVDTSYSKEYFRNLKGMIADHEQTKWLSDKMTTIADQVGLYKCSGKKCNAVFSQWKFFLYHINVHCHIARKDAKSQEETRQFMTCMYCFKSFGVNNVNELTKHIFDDHSFSKYFCQYCLYRAYTASHVLIHQYMIHNKQKPSILELQDLAVYGTIKEIVKVVDFNKFVLRYVCNIGNCAFYSYTNSDFLYHLNQDHENCDQFYCDICDKRDRSGFVSLNPTSFIKHFNLHSINTYQCIFCLFGAEFINLMIIHLAMEHFEYEPLCLERRPINDFCDGKKIENLKILNIKKCIPAGIIKIVNSKSQIDLNTEVNQINEKCQADLIDTCTNTKIFKVENTTQLSRKSTNTAVCSSKNTLKPAIDNKKNMVISDVTKKNVPRDTQRISKVWSSIGKNKEHSSQLLNYDITNLRFSSDESMDQCKFNSNKNSNKIIPVGITYQDHLNNCPTETPIECTFCLAQSESTFDVVELPKLIISNCFTCTFCNLDLPSSVIAKSHVKEVHNISNIEFVPVDINATDIKKDRFLVCEDKVLKRQKRANDNKFYSKVLNNMNLTSMKRSKVINTHDDSQSTTTEIIKNTLKQEIKCEPDASEQQQKTTKRKHSNESINNVAVVDYKKKPSCHRLYDTIPLSKMDKYFTPNAMDKIPQTPVFLNPIGCLLCEFHTKLRSNLVLHLNWHTVELYMSDLSNKPMPIDTASKLVNNPSCSSFEVKQNEKIRTVEYSVDDLILKSTTESSSCQPGNNFPQFVPRDKLFKCPYDCNYIGENMEILERHIRHTYDHPKFYFYICPHCRPSIVRFKSLYDLESHFHFHGIDLYICLYCDYIHYNPLHIESHQKITHQLRTSDNKFNIVTIRSQNLDQPTGEWKCNACMSGIKYSTTQIFAHLSIVHKISNMFKCLICKNNHSNYEALEQHFKLRHPSVEVKYLNEHFDRISPVGVKLQTNVEEHASSNENHLLNVLEAFDGVTEPTPALHTLQETPIKSLDISGYQRKIFDKLSGKLVDLKFICSMIKCECPVCNTFAEKKKRPSRELLKEMNCTIWKCLECFSFIHSAETMEINVIKYKQLKQKFKEIKISKKKCLFDGIIEFQNILIHELLKSNYQHANCDDQNGTEHGNVQ